MTCRLRQMLTKTRLCAIDGRVHAQRLVLRDLETENAALASTEPILLPDTPRASSSSPPCTRRGGVGLFYDGAQGYRYGDTIGYMCEGADAVTAVDAEGAPGRAASDRTF